MAVALGAIAAAQDAAPPRAHCGDAAECRRLALDAAERREFEAFHDLAWRAVQLGPRNDPALLFLLARAPSLSGRPHDALVMLRRVAPAGVAAEAIGSDEFAIVRTLREWPDVEAAIVSRASDTPAAATLAGPPAAAPVPATARIASVPTPAPTAGVPDAFTFSSPSLRPSALAYDAVSRRFIVSDRDVSRLAVIDEFSHQVATLVSGASAGFGTVTAVEIEPSVGNLWVASVDASSGEERPMLHKLQLISGRVLKAYARRSAGGRFADVAVRGDGTVIAVDSSRGQLVRLRPGAPSFERVGAVESGATSVTMSGDGTVYVAADSGIYRAGAGRIKPPRNVELSGVARIRWHRGSLIALQSTGDDAHRLLRIRLSGDGRSATRIDVLDAAARVPSTAAMTIVDGELYYVVEGAGGDFAVRRIRL